MEDNYGNEIKTKYPKKERRNSKLKKVFKSKWLIIFVIAVAVFCFGFTYIANFANQTKYSYVINNYQDNVSSMSDKEIKTKEEKAKEYNKSLNDLALQGKCDKSAVGYYDVLNLGEIISYVDIPKIDVYLPIYNSTDEKTLQNGIGHEKGSSLPVGGKNTNCVLLGHSGLTTNPLFTDLHTLTTGDYIYLKTMNKTYTYKVSDIYTVTPAKAEEYTEIVQNKDIVTLITCTPIGINTHRLIVRGERVQSTTNNKEQITKSNQTEDNNNNNIENTNRKIFTVILIFIVLFVFLILVHFIKKRE